MHSFARCETSAVTCLGVRAPREGPRSAVLAPEREHTAPAPGRGAAVLAYLLLLQFRITTSVVA